MNLSDKNLFNNLAIALVLKLAILVALWWVYVRDQRVAVDGNSVAAQFLTRAPTTAQGSKP
jgi:hypothetical protein